MSKTHIQKKIRSSGVGVGVLGMAALLLSSCAMPSREAWQQIRSEGLVRFMAADRLHRQMESDSRVLSSGATEYLAGHERVDGEDLEAELSDIWTNWDDSTVRNLSPLVPDEQPLLTALPVAGRSGQVMSPHATGKTVDVSSFFAGEEVRCPHSGLAFLVPRFPTPPVRIADLTSGEHREKMSFEPQVPTVPREVPERFELPDAAPVAPVKTVRMASSDEIAAERVPGRKNLVYSPYANRQQIVDVRGLNAGDKARCPFTNKIFVVPEHASAAPSGEVAQISQSIDFRVLGDVGQGERLGAAKNGAAVLPVVPTAVWSGRDGYVSSPFGEHLIDVSGKTPGVVVRCPFSGKLFRVPAGSD